MLHPAAMDAALRFPVHLRAGPVDLPLHLLLESLAYLIGFQLYSAPAPAPGRPPGGAHPGLGGGRRRARAAAGSKVVYWLSDPWLSARQAAAGDVAFLMAGKSIAGALAGGLIAVEAVKQRLGVRPATGDLFAVPLAVGMAVGRLGCFLAGLDDHTYGLPATLPWAVDFGDGIPRHPTQLYEALFLILLVPLLLRLQRPAAPGEPPRRGRRVQGLHGGLLRVPAAAGVPQAGRPLAWPLSPSSGSASACCSTTPSCSSAAGRPAGGEGGHGRWLSACDRTCSTTWPSPSAPPASARSRRRSSSSRTASTCSSAAPSTAASAS